jgi:hypothetical protein
MNNNYTRNLVGVSFGRCLRSRLLSGSSMRITIRFFWTCAVGSTVLRAVAADLVVLVFCPFSQCGCTELR